MDVFALFGHALACRVLCLVSLMNLSSGFGKVKQNRKTAKKLRSSVTKSQNCEKVTVERKKNAKLRKRYALKSPSQKLGLKGVVEGKRMPEQCAHKRNKLCSARYTLIINTLNSQSARSFRPAKRSASGKIRVSVGVRAKRAKRAKSAFEC